MLKRLTEADRILDLLDKYAPFLRQAFEDAIAVIRDAVILKAIVVRLEKRDIEGAISLLDLDNAVFARFELALADAYNGGGLAFVDTLPRVTDPQGGRVNFRFGVRNTVGEQELRQHSSNLVTGITADIKDALRSAFSDGLAAGENPKRTASQVVGFYNPATGHREGGIIGLSSAQERYVASARAELTSLTTSGLGNYFQRERRNKQFDSRVRKAAESGWDEVAAQLSKRRGKKISAWQAREEVIVGYSNGLLKLRGETIARTETMWALSKSREDGIRQQIDAGKLDARDVTKEWHSLHDNRTRFTHLELDGQSVPFGGKFQSVSGAMLSYPHDPSAPASEIVNCRCMLTYKIDRIAAFRRQNGL